MCHQLEKFRDATIGFAAAFDPARLTVADARAVVCGATLIENSWSAIKALAAARVAETGDQRPHARRVAAEDLARTTGTTLGAARNTLDVGRRLRSQPEVGAAARRGELSPAQAAAITDAAAADPTAEQRLLDTAIRTSLPELRDACARTKAAAEPDPDRRYAEIRAGRRLRHWTDSAGVGHLHASGPVDDLAQIAAALGPRAERRFQAARRDGRREPPEAYTFDALVELALDATTGAGRAGAAAAAPDAPTGDGGRARHGAAVKLLLKVDLDTWLRGFPIDDEVCELVGHGHLPVSVVNKLLAQGDPFVAAILTSARTVVGVAHLGRRPTAYQRSALEWLYPSCAALGCTAQAHLEVDHREDWAKTHFTMLDWLDRLCRAHHLLKTRDGWALVDGTGKRAFVPPDDPRHPCHARVRA